jgi:thiamine biosynthesis lipoprotein
MLFNDHFRAMGTDVEVLIDASAPPFAGFLSIRLLFESQEALFSRFQPASLLSRLNSGETVEHPSFAAACRLAREAHEFTGGIFNPMVLPALVEAGYDRSFEAVTGGRLRRHGVPDPRECILIDGDTVRLRQGALDLGGIVKGWTVDLAVELVGDWVDGVLVNAGGDLRTTGSEPGTRGWQVEVDAPGGGIAWEGVLDGALATSTTLKRRWRTVDGDMAHHLIDPRTGLPANGPAAQVSAWGAEAWRAECWAKAVLIGGDDVASRARAAGLDVLALGQDGRAIRCDRRGGDAQPAVIAPGVTS